MAPNVPTEKIIIKDELDDVEQQKIVEDSSSDEPSGEKAVESNEQSYMEATFKHGLTDCQMLVISVRTYLSLTEPAILVVSLWLTLLSQLLVCVNE